jgi:hypothetical protein
MIFEAGGVGSRSAWSASRLAGAFDLPPALESGSKLRALQTLARLSERLGVTGRAGVFGTPSVFESGSKLHALHTLARHSIAPGLKKP